MLPGNAKCSMTSLADTKHIFRERKKDLFIDSLIPRRSLLIRCPREVRERAGERTPSQYWENTSDFSAILPLVTFYEFVELHFGKPARQ